MGYSIRRMQVRDIPQALKVDREAFPTQWPHPSYNSFKQELNNRLACYIVATGQRGNETTKQNFENKSFWRRILHIFSDDRLPTEEKTLRPQEYIVGIAGFWMMVYEAHITTLAVRNACRRQGVGEMLLISIIEMAAQFNANVVTLEVRASNKQAQTLYEKYGFQKVGVRRAYYSDNGEDAVLMTTDSLMSSIFQSRFQKLKQNHMQRWNELYSNEPSKVA